MNARPNDSFIEFPIEEIEQSIHERFARQVCKHPDKVAIKTGASEWTYAELNAAANRVAHAILSQRGAGEEPVALLIGHGAMMIAAILGTLKAGKICVPLDPSYPRERTIHVLNDSQAELVLTDNEHLSSAVELNQDRSLLLNIDELDSAPPKDFKSIVASGALALILYTSGSTGQPKGVIQTHRNVLHNTRQYTNSFHICPADRMTLLFSCGVQSGIANLFYALLNGATLYPFSVKVNALPALIKLLIDEEITIYHSAPTVFRHFTGALPSEEIFPALRLIQLSSERVLARDVELYQQHFLDTCQLRAGLGATETAGGFRQYMVDKRTRLAGSVVPAGYAVEGKDVLLLNDEGREVGFGVVGEIVVKSRYLSPGYWRNPELTQSVFSSAPEGGDMRLYRTGDLGRLHPDGCLEYMGRKDFQINIRGYRVEAAEVEGALLGVSGIKEAVVAVRENHYGDQCLVAYVVLDRKPAPDISEISDLLANELPTHMVPTNFVVLDAMPLTPNGKVDRLALPAPTWSRDELNASSITPLPPAERVIAKIWAEVLKLKCVSAHDNFFELGGHSLLATQIVSRVRDATGVTLPLRIFFGEAATVAGMAVAVTRLQVQEHAAGLE